MAIVLGESAREPLTADGVPHQIGKQCLVAASRLVVLQATSVIVAGGLPQMRRLGQWEVQLLIPE